MSEVAGFGAVQLRVSSVVVLLAAAAAGSGIGLWSTRPGPPVPIRGIGVLACGAKVRGTTAGAPFGWMGTAEYERWSCPLPKRNRDHAGEQVFELELPPGTEATLMLRSRDLDLVAIAGGRPKGSELPPACGAAFRPERGVSPAVLVLDAETAPLWFVVVEGVERIEGAFELEIACSLGR